MDSTEDAEYDKRLKEAQSKPGLTEALMLDAMIRKTLRKYGRSHDGQEVSI